MRRRFVLLLALALVAGLQTVPVAAHGDPAVVGRFLEPFEEPGAKCTTRADGTKDCKPAAGSMAMLVDGRVLYWNALEGTENVENGIAFEFGRVSANDQSRVLSFDEDGATWLKPSPVDGGTKNDGEYVLPKELVEDPEHNDDSLFCTDLVQLADGRILVVGGTDYYNEPGIGGYGYVELEGTKTTRVFDPKTNTWTQAKSMRYGRWYPSLVTLGDGSVFVASGVTKLMKPVYQNRPGDSGTNVKQTETYDPKTDTWGDNGAQAERSLPLFPRLHLLPDGQVFYNAGGQTFNPAGQSYDEALWNIAAVYDPTTKSWSDLGVPGLNSSAPGFRGSAFSAMLPLRPDTATGEYTKAQFLTAGGVLGTTPGGYVAIKDSTITTVDTAGGEAEMTTEPTGSLNNARWYSSGVTLPDGSVLALSGADRDEVVAPGTGFPVKEAELFDPATKRWTRVDAASKTRTYHNTALLLPDGRVLVGGHAPIPTLYGKNQTLPGGFSENDGRDPSFEIYEPPYLFRGDRPVIEGVAERLRHGQTVTIATPQGADIDSVMLARNATVTHVIDNDQRMVELRVVSRTPGSVTVQVPANANAVPAGPYMLFINKGSAKGRIPSVAAQVFVHDPASA